MNKSLLYLLAVLIGFLIFNGCNFINPQEPIPAYLKIAEFKLLDTSTNVEAIKGSYRITDVWVYVDNNPQGVYELPCTIPVLSEGTHTVQLYAGILENGIASTRTEYPFYYTYSQKVNFIPDSVHVLQPNCNYKNSTEFVLNEDFEGLGFLIDTTSNSKAKLEKADGQSDSNVFEGQYSGMVKMNANIDSFEALSVEAYNIPKNRTVYLEINYLSDNELMVGVIASKNGILYYFEPKITLYPNSAWKKIYINFTPEVNEMLNFIPNAKIKILLSSKHRSVLDNSIIYFDNIKLVY